MHHAAGMFTQYMQCRREGIDTFDKWYNVNPEVIEGIRKGSIKHLRLCKKCFKE
jgi:hypothetical protein